MKRSSKKTTADRKSYPPLPPSSFIIFVLYVFFLRLPFFSIIQLQDCSKFVWLGNLANIIFFLRNSQLFFNVIFSLTKFSSKEKKTQFRQDIFFDNNNGFILMKGFFFKFIYEMK